MNIPNTLTILRFIMVPVFGYYVYDKQYILAVIIFTMAGLTDVLDGLIARRYNMITSWGKLADPAADKLMQLTALIMLNIQGKIPLILVIAAIFKDLIISVGSFLIYHQNKMIVQANWYGKLTTVILYISIVAVLFNIAFSEVLIIISLLSVLFSFIMYAVKFLKIKEYKNKKVSSGSP